MENNKETLPAAGSDQCAQNTEIEAPHSPRQWMYLALTLGVCILAVDSSIFFALPGLGITALVIAWYGLVGAQLGWSCFRRGECRFLLGMNLLLACSFAVNSNGFFRLWNLGALAILLPIHAASLSGAGRKQWWEPSMLWERLRFFLSGLFGNPGAITSLAAGNGKLSKKRAGTWILGAGAALLVVILLMPVLISADALFANTMDSAYRFICRHLTAGIVRVLLGLVLTPFVFGLLQRMREPKIQPEKAAKTALPPNSLPFSILLAALDLLYLLFLGVQLSGLTGGAAYLARHGISYAEWARSGFFQMTGVTLVNLAAVLLALRWGRGAGKTPRALRILAAALLSESLLLLISAAWRMSLYVGAYGLSFKRVMTYWGMAMMAIFLLAALAAVERPAFRFYQAAFLAALIGWMVINCVPVDALVARNAVDRYLRQEESVDFWYLINGLSYDTLHQLERLENTDAAEQYRAEWGVTLSSALETRRESARKECEKWEQWNLSAYLAGRG